MTSERPRFRLGFLTHVQGRGTGLALQATATPRISLWSPTVLGFDVGWVAQHHVPLGGGGLSSPWTFLAHAAARTTRIRLGTAVTHSCCRAPVGPAQDVATVDALSGGRVELGVGSGSGDLEYAAFGRDMCPASAN
ncbi:F420-dependent glucose-6-phosphate dehydrogenase [Streptomyces tendae]